MQGMVFGKWTSSALPDEGRVAEADRRLKAYGQVA